MFPKNHVDRLVAWISLVGGIAVFVAIQMEPVLRAAVTDDGSYSSGGNTKPNECGDGKIRDNEECDDKNKTANDGCSASCKVEKGWVCIDEPSKCKKEHKCCICIYENSYCEGKNRNDCLSRPCANGIDDDGDGTCDMGGCTDAAGKKMGPDLGCLVPQDDEGDGANFNDCGWNDFEKKCTSVWAQKCNELFAAKPWADECQTKKRFQQGENYENHPDLQKCTETEEDISAHGRPNSCQELKEHIRMCRSLSNKTTIRHLGCSVFKETSAFDAYVAKLQSGLKPNETLSVTANQGDSDLYCTTFKRYQVTIERIDVSYDPCNVGGNCVAGNGETVKCSRINPTTNKKEIVSQTCCGGDVFKRKWQPGNACKNETGSCFGESPVIPPQYNTTKCYEVANKWKKPAGQKSLSYYDVETALSSCRYVRRDVCWKKGGDFKIDCKKTLTVKEAPLDKKDPTGPKFRYCTAAQINCNWTCTY